MPFIYKRAVFDATVTSSLLYTSETWLTNNNKVIEQQYNKLIKCLLGVRRNTSINLCMVEAGIPPVQALIDKKRFGFLKLKRDRMDPDEPFHRVYRVCSEENTPAA